MGQIVLLFVPYLKFLKDVCDKNKIKVGFNYFSLWERLLKIFLKEQYEPNHIVLLPHSDFKGRYGSITDNTVHGVQIDNTVQ